MIYLDHASTTYVYPEVVDAIANTMRDSWGNPSNIYKFGEQSKKLIDEARTSIANCIGAKPNEILFTSGASEGNALVAIQKPHPLCSPYEHHNFTHNPNETIIDRIWLNKALGHRKEQLEEGLQPEDYSNFLLSWMYVNNETGEIYDIKRIGECAHKLGMLFHSDMTQALGNLPINVKDLGVDFATFSGHKVHSSKGWGFIYVNSETVHEITPLIHGGVQEFNARAGTENIPYIVGGRLAITKACTPLMRSFKETTCSKFKKYCIETLTEELKDDIMIVSPGRSIASTLMFCLKDISSEVLQQILSDKEIYIGTGSACTGDSQERSGTLSEMGIPEDFIDGAVRLSFDIKNTMPEIRKAVQEIITQYRILKP